MGQEGIELGTGHRSPLRPHGWTVRKEEEMHDLRFDEPLDEGFSFARAAEQRRLDRERLARAISGPSSVKSGFRFDAVMTTDERDALRQLRKAESPADELPSVQRSCDQTGPDPQFGHTRSLDTEDLQEGGAESSSIGIKCDQTGRPFGTRRRSNPALTFLALRMLRASSPFTGIRASSLAEATNVSLSTAQRELRRLVASGEARQRGSRSTRRYFSATGGN
jgi:hypothetical protein